MTLLEGLARAGELHGKTSWWLGRQELRPGGLGENPVTTIDSTAAGHRQCGGNSASAKRRTGQEMISRLSRLTLLPPSDAPTSTAGTAASFEGDLHSALSRRVCPDLGDRLRLDAGANSMAPGQMTRLHDGAPSGGFPAADGWNLKPNSFRRLSHSGHGRGLRRASPLFDRAVPRLLGASSNWLATAPAQRLRRWAHHPQTAAPNGVKSYPRVSR